MNLITNNCLGGWYYKLNDMQFENPFVWNWIEPNNYFKLVRDFNNIDFYKINTTFVARTNDSDAFVCVTLDNGVKIDFIHHKYNRDMQEIKKIGADLYSRDILRDLVNKWYNRVDRMMELNEPPVFVYTMNVAKQDNIEWIRVMDSLLELDRDDIHIITYTELEETHKTDTKTHLYSYPDDIMCLGNMDFCRNTIAKIKLK